MERTNLENALNQLTATIKDYRQNDYPDGDTLCAYLKTITGILYYLEGVRSEVHQKWQETANKYVLEGMSWSRSENQANLEVPELYKLRHIMTASYEVVGAIRSSLSWLKTEKYESK